MNKTLKLISEELRKIQIDLSLVAKRVDSLLASPASGVEEPQLPTRKGAERRIVKVWKALPTEFTLYEAIGLCEKNGAKRSPAAYWHPLEKLVRLGWLEKISDSGPKPSIYRKRNPFKVAPSPDDAGR
ncbi:MAG: hypothetical protein DME24_22710 [Verrucomicrobia bacterium]|nr:MAG: hypothetical protein DME24_22710 [Verrucomicrobiota bacterium]